LNSKYAGIVTPIAEADPPLKQPLFTSDGRRALAACVTDNVLLAFDYDGTLAPIVHDPEHVALRPRTQALLRAVARRYPIAVLSGRRESDITRRIKGTGVWVAAGHDARWIEGSRPLDDVRAQVASWQETAARALRLRRDIQIEPKEFALALHYRQAADPDEALRAITTAVGSLEGARIVFGNHVVNVIPPGTLSKAAVLTRICRDFACDTILYVGDDEEDEEVFRLGRVLPMFGVRVGEANKTAARYCLPKQRDVDRLLRQLCDLRGEGLPA
jgi:trehalose 6-phosphate phosphatase